MSLRPRLDNYIFPSGEPYLYPKGGMSSYVGDQSGRVIKNIVPNNYKSYQLFPKEFSNKPKLSYMFKAENGHFSQKEIPTRKTGQIKFVKSDFIKKVEPKRLLPNSVINMRNQVMSDGYPQNPSLIHQKQSETHKLGVIQKQIEEFELLSQDPRIDPAKQVEFKNQADSLMITYFPNQVMIKQYSQMIDELKNVKDEIAAGGGMGGGGIPLTPPSKSLITTDIQVYLTDKETEKLGEDFKNAVDKKDLKQLTKIAEYLGFDKAELSKMKPEDIEMEVEYFITNNVETIKPDITIPFTNIPERDKAVVERLTLHNLTILETLYKKDSKEWFKVRGNKDSFIMNYILNKQPYLTEMDVFALKREFQSDNKKNWWSRAPTSLMPILDKFIAVKFPTSSKK